MVALLLALSAQDAKTYHIRASDLPAPYASRSADQPPQIEARDGAPLHVPAGYRVEPWISGLDRPRNLTTAPNGDVFVAESFNDRVLMLRPRVGTGPEKQVFATGCKQVYGIAFYPPENPRFIYVANTDAVLRYPYRSGDTKIQDSPTRILSLPGGGYHQHWTRNLLFSRDGKKLYVTVGSATNVSSESSPRASILECDPDGTHLITYASGLRNPVGIAWQPGTNTLWAAVNERDELGDKLPPDYVTSIKKDGFYGWPFYYIGKNRDPRMPEMPELKAKSLVPDVLLEAHCAALGVAFPNQKTWPKDGFVSMHGSWNRSDRSGYKVCRFPMSNGKATGEYVDFVWGWKTKEGKIWGRPVDVEFDKSGALLISDDGGGVIWRVIKQ